MPQSLRQLGLTPSAARRTRFLILAIALFITIFYLLPTSSTHQSGTSVTKTSKTSPAKSPFHIQFDFGPETESDKRIREDRQQQVLHAFQHAWKGYRDHAWLHDELKPISGGQKDPYVGWAATLVDSLDSLYIMGLHDEFEHALKALDSIDFTKPKSDQVPVFEVTIRYLGGLLGAYDVSGAKYPVLLKKADQLGEFLLQAFKTPNGIPVPYYSWETPKKKLSGKYGVLVAQIGSLSLEFTRLAQLTGKQKYFAAISKITNHLHRAQKKTKIPGLWPSQVDTNGPYFASSAFTLGAWADSLYEYLPKQHILLNGQTTQYLQMYRTALQPITKYHLFRPKTPGNQDILFPGSLDSMGRGEPTLKDEVQHLACFVGGMVGLGARINNSPEELATAVKLTDGCVWAYQNTASGIMPEIFHVEACPSKTKCEWTDTEHTDLGRQFGFTQIPDTKYQLRPEAIESVFVMYRLTGDREWQQKGWKMFRAIMEHTTTPLANAAITDVTKPMPKQEDSMESFWLAETLKYFYLLYSEPDVVSLDDYVLNTEAHPFKLRDHLF